MSSQFNKWASRGGESCGTVMKTRHLGDTPEQKQRRSRADNLLMVLCVDAFQESCLIVGRSDEHSKRDFQTGERKIVDSQATRTGDVSKSEAVTGHSAFLS